MQPLDQIALWVGYLVLALGSFLAFAFAVFVLAAAFIGGIVMRADSVRIGYNVMIELFHALKEIKRVEQRPPGENTKGGGI